MRERLLQSLLVAFFALVLAGSATLMLREYTKVHTFVTMGDVWTFFQLGDEAPAIVGQVDRKDYLSSPYPVPGDSLLAINGRPASRHTYFDVFGPEVPEGHQVEFTFCHEGEVFRSTAVTRSIPDLLRIQVVTLYSLRGLTVLALILVGLWAFLRRPASSPVRVLALFCWTTASAIIITYTVLPNDYATFNPSLANLFWTVMGLLTLFAPVFWVKLHLVFPDEYPRYARRRLLWDILLFVPGVILIGWLGPAAPPNHLYYGLYTLILVATGFFFLIRNVRRSQDFLHRRQTWLVLMGSVPGLSLYALYPFVVAGAGALGLEWSTTATLYYTNAVALLMLLIPITFAYAFERYRLLEVQGRLKRGTRILLINAAVLALFVGVLYSTGELLIDNLEVDSRTSTLAVGIALALGFVPAQRRLRDLLEARFYPERRRLRELLRDFLHSSDTFTDQARFWGQLAEKLTSGLAAGDVYPILRGRQVVWQQDGSAAGSKGIGVEDTDALIEQLGSVDHPLLIDEILAAQRVQMNSRQLRWLEDHQAAILLPLKTRSGLLGFLLLGRKTTGEDYAPEELELLRTLSAQIALAVENIELLQDRLERQRLEEQLSVARQIQQGLLPRQLPQSAGLELAATIRFCLDVAGDYYDVMELPDGRTLLAVGDVAGKGVGAALLMANLQALLRAEKDRRMVLPEVMQKINTLIHENTSTEMFITLFVATYDPVSHEFCYVNAGHDYPILMRSDGAMQSLSEGGLILGVGPSIRYEQAVIRLEPEDVLLLYTDGAREARNAADEEFGEKRLEAALHQARMLPTHEVVRHLEQAVIEFTGREDFEDDFTLLVARVGQAAGVPEAARVVRAEPSRRRAR